MEKEEAKSLILEKIRDSKRQRRRKMNIIKYIKTITVFLCLFVIFFICTFGGRKKEEIVGYTEKSDVDYNVFLKENKFYKTDYLPKDNRYVASLIDNIKPKFDYSLKLNKRFNGSYSYKIIAEMSIKKEKTEEIIYADEKEIFSESDVELKNIDNVTISKEVQVDYSEYNDLVTEFVKEYGISSYDNQLNICMYVTIKGLEEEFVNKKVASLSIPLSEVTTIVEINYNLLNSQSDIKVKDNEINKKMLFLTIGSGLIALYFIIDLIRYITHTTNALNTYKTELKKILTDYRQYIQVINNEFNMEGYQKLELNSFIDLLEIRDTVQEPIFMIEHKKENETIFILPTKNKLACIFKLSVN